MAENGEVAVAEQEPESAPEPEPEASAEPVDAEYVPMSEWLDDFER